MKREVKKEVYNQLGNLLQKILNTTEKIDLQMLCDSFIIAFDTNKRNANSKELSFSISDGNKTFSIDIKMNEEQIIQYISANEYKEE